MCEVVYQGLRCPRNSKWNIVAPLKTVNACGIHKNRFVAALNKFNADNFMSQYFELAGYSITEL